MFPYAIRAIERLTPKAFVFENVKGLLRASFADYFEYIILRLTSLLFGEGSGAALAAGRAQFHPGGCG